MKARTIFVFVLCLFSVVGVYGQGRFPQQGPPATDKVTPNIPGFVAAGTKIEIIKFGLRGADGAVAMPDGTLLLATNGGIAKVDDAGNLTVLVEDSKQAAGFAVDAKGRVFGAQYSKKVSILYPKDVKRRSTSTTGAEIICSPTMSNRMER